MPTRLEVLLQSRKSAAAGLLHRHSRRQREHRHQAGGHACGEGGQAARIFSGHAAKLYQIIDDFA
jgi:hypothetical protein